MVVVTVVSGEVNIEKRFRVWLRLVLMAVVLVMGGIFDEYNGNGLFKVPIEE